jgi:hypothetical protein
MIKICDGVLRQLWYVRLQALVNLRLYQLALAELDKLGDLNRQEYTFEYHQGLFPGKSGLMIPFELRVLSANLPGLMKHYNNSIERLTILAMECQKVSGNILFHLYISSHESIILTTSLRCN